MYVISKWKVVFFSGVKCECLRPLKWQKFIFYTINIFFSIDATIPKCFLVRQKYVCFEKKKFLMGNQNWQKNWIWKFENPPKWPNFRVLGFSNSNFFVIFGFPSKKNVFFLTANILLSSQKDLGVDSINREENTYIRKGKFSHFRGVSTHILLRKKRRHLSLWNNVYQKWEKNWTCVIKFKWKIFLEKITEYQGMCERRVQPQNKYW